MSNSARIRLLAWPALLFLVAFFLVPAGMVIGYSILERDFYGQVHLHLSLDGWRQAIEPATLKVLCRSIGLALTVTVACLGLGYPCALALAKVKQPWRAYWAVLISFPLVTSLLLRIYGWMNLLPLESRGTMSTVVLVMTVNYLPFMLLPLIRAVEEMDSNLTDAALDLGATSWQAFRLVTWPITRPGAWAGCALVFIPATGDYLVPHFIGEGRFNVLGLLIVQQFMERRNWPYAAASSVWLLATVCVPLLIWIAGTRMYSSLRAEREAGFDG
jgi:spermidine/putrescine transport system permease protein